MERKEGRKGERGGSGTGRRGVEVKKGSRILAMEGTEGWEENRRERRKEGKEKRIKGKKEGIMSERRGGRGETSVICFIY